jgi:hypothetical protein
MYNNDEITTATEKNIGDVRIVFLDLGKNIVVVSFYSAHNIDRPFFTKELYGFSSDILYKSFRTGNDVMRFINLHK